MSNIPSLNGQPINIIMSLSGTLILIDTGNIVLTANQITSIQNQYPEMSGASVV